MNRAPRLRTRHRLRLFGLYPRHRRSEWLQVAPTARLGGPGWGRQDAVGIYVRYAAGCLAVTVLSGVWLRSVFIESRLLGGLSFPHLVHAHSHIAFFGWTSMGVFALMLLALRGARPARWLRVHANAVGIGSVAAFVGFMLAGYNRYTIALAALHVVLWVAFAAAVWRPLSSATTVERRYFRGALVFLLLAGAGAVAPTVVRVQGLEDAWVKQLSVELFLTPFVAGWLLLGVFGAIYARLQNPRFARVVFPLVALGVFPSIFLHIALPTPLAWLGGVGQAGTVMLGAASLLFAADVLRAAKVPPLLLLAAAAAIAKGGAEILTGVGVTYELAASRQIVIAYLHLVLLGLITPALLATVFAPPRSAPRLAGVYAVGIAMMLGSLVGLGWPALGLLLNGAGLTPPILLQLALAGGALVAVAVLLYLFALARVPAARGAAVSTQILNREPTRPSFDEAAA